MFWNRNMCLQPSSALMCVAPLLREFVLQHHALEVSPFVMSSGVLTPQCHLSKIADGTNVSQFNKASL